MVKIDFIEWRDYMVSRYNVRRDLRAINRCRKRAIVKNATDGRTYYIMQDISGNFNEMNRDQLYACWRVGLITKDQFNRRLFHARALVTSDRCLLNQYSQQQLKKEDEK